MKTKAKKPIQSVRLSKDIIPQEYDLTLHPDLESHLFTGEEVITLTLAKSTKTITLHSKDLEILEVKVGDMAATITYDTSLETAMFTFAKTIAKGSIKLSIVFRGVLSDNMRGFYKSQYVVDGETRTMATTQFEATDARRAFPCFDEPAHKAVFHVHLVVADGRTPISNTLPIATREHSAGYKIVSFAPTPKMSTYLLAFIVGDFEWVEQKTTSGVLVRIMTIPGKKHQAKFSLDVTVRCLEFYEKYFAIPYPLDTLDMIAIPDFSSLAMENWGAITFREIGLLVDEENTSSVTREMVAEVIAHELAHQWFGNLVTMEWWTHLWLNEGFASYIPYLALSELFPSWNMWDRFATDTTAIALKLDALSNTHPIEVPVHHPNEIGEIFDAVSYSKGASVIRMLADYLGDKDFRDGLRYYLKKHSYQNASTVHLWDAFEYVSKKPVKKMMAIWTTKSGYPVVRIEQNKKGYTLTQTRHYSSSHSRTQSTDTTIWPIPLSYTSDRGTKTLPLMNKKAISFIDEKSVWVKLNTTESGLYRTEYSDALLASLTLPVSEGRLTPVDRLGIIRDLFALSESGRIPTPTALAFAQHYANETEYIVWVEIISGLRYIANLVAGNPSEKLLARCARTLLATAIERVGWEPRTAESHTDGLLRTLILGAGSYFGDISVIREAQRRFNNRAESPISADLRGVIYTTVVRNGGVAEYESILALYRIETLHEEKNRLLSALGTTTNITLLKKTLQFIMSDEVRMQDRNSAFASVLVNPRGRALGWEFIKRNWKAIGEAYGDGNHLLSRLIQALNRNTTREAYNDIKIFFKKNKAPAAERTILQTLEHVDSNVRWLARDGKRIEKWLKGNK